jgi:hypothetical protein
MYDRLISLAAFATRNSNGNNMKRLAGTKATSSDLYAISTATTNAKSAKNNAQRTKLRD